VFETALLLAAVFGPMIVEARIAARHERLQLLRGGIEPPNDVFPIMRIGYPIAFLSMVVEGALRGRPARPVVVAGIVLFVTAKLLKWWAIRHLGSRWTFRLIVVPGGQRIA